MFTDLFLNETVLSMMTPAWLCCLGWTSLARGPDAVRACSAALVGLAAERHNVRWMVKMD